MERMKMEPKNTKLQQKSLQQNPFSVPEGYFERFPGRLKERMAEVDRSEVPVRRIGSSRRLRVALAAAMLGAALISYTLIRFVSINSNGLEYYNDIALLEQLDIMDDDQYLVEFLEEGDVEMEDEEAFINQAMEYLAFNDVEMDLIFE